MEQTKIRIDATGVCEIVIENESGKKRESIFRLDANTSVDLIDNTVSVITSTGSKYDIVLPDYITARLEYDRLADAVAEAINEASTPHRRIYQRLRDVEIILVNDDCLPTLGTDGSAGYDCKVDIDAVKELPGYDADTNMYELKAGEVKLLSLGFYMHIGNEEYEAQLRPRSGKGSKGLVLGNLTGTIDSDYQGVVMACLWNRTEQPLKVDLTQPVCQMVFNRVEHPRFNIVDQFEETDRGEGGFGSTDKKANN